MATKNIEIQDSDGNIYYPHTNASVVKNGSTTVAEQLKDIANKQTKLENTVSNIDLSATKVNLATINGMSAKNVQAGMQELFTFASNGKSAIAGKVGNVTGSNTHTEIANRIQTDKNTAAANLNSKNVSASGNEALASLVSKIAQISVQGMGGKRFINGMIEITTGSSDSSFAPQISFSVGVQIEYFILYHISNKNNISIQILMPDFIKYMYGNLGNGVNFYNVNNYGSIATATGDTFTTMYNPTSKLSYITNGKLYYFVVGI